MTIATSYETHMRLRAVRAQFIADLVVTFLWDVATGVRRMYRLLRRQRRAAAAQDALLELDDRALRDIGLRRSDLGATAHGRWRPAA